MGTNPAIRVIALALIRRPATGELLVFQAYDDARDLTYHRPLGGGVEFGETFATTVRRELMEELGVAVTAHGVIGVTEAVFTQGGRRHHEVAAVLDCAFDDRTLYDRAHFPDIERAVEPGVWRAPASPVTLYPEQLPALLSRWDRAAPRLCGTTAPTMHDAGTRAATGGRTDPARP